LRRIALDWIKDDRGQDIVEYSLLIAFVAFASAAIFNLSGGSIKGIWCQVNSELVTGAAQAS
jgi:Flp pilus assembly pilin Flp